MPKNKFDIIGILQEHGAIVSGHFKLPSGFHSQTYIQTSTVLQYPHIAQKIAKEMADKFPQEINVVISPNPAIIVIGQEIARIKQARSIFTERVEGVMVLKRNFKINENEKVLIVDDVFSTGKICAEAISLARNYKAKVVGVAAIVDRSTGELPFFNVPVRGLVSYPLELYTPENCPLCQKGVPLTVISASNK
ncbi:MAG: orotate phosphoribosyltransferase [Elusimicrobiales bacterium]|nr:orotate phosphoribosyltransferase [Elusimicrobiales bacterium]HOL61855.1 orotate phosphoribosyltransferase [Elusimicrobiales bacterium]HPO95190.1 orotate phosphoribosyltransferase [Elusimicrobiales bacterium]